MRRLCDGIGASMRVRCEMIYQRGVPALVNDDAVLDRVVRSVRGQCGDVIGEVEAVMGGEDFALMANLVPSFQLKVGSGQPGRSDDLHNSDYQPDEACIGLGVQALARAAVDILS